MAATAPSYPSRSVIRISPIIFAARWLWHWFLAGCSPPLGGPITPQLVLAPRDELARSTARLRCHVRIDWRQWLALGPFASPSLMICIMARRWLLMCAQVLGGLLRDPSLLLAVRPHFSSSLGPQVLHCCSVPVGRAIKDKWHNLFLAFCTRRRC